MGRRGSMRGRPSFLFIIVFAVFLIIFYLSWKSLMSPNINTNTVYSTQGQSFFDKSGSLQAKVESSKRFVGGNHDQDQQYDLGSAVNQKKINAAILQQRESFVDKEEITSRSAVIKPEKSIVKSSKSQTLQAELYHQINPLIFEKVTSMERFVHLDLKGAAPKMSYLRLFIPLIKKLGATGLLIEYEDMFPYTGVLEHISARNAYSMGNIKELLRLAEINELKVMPLIQTFGHMEFVLKSEFSKLRESDYTPEVIDITQNASYALITEMIKQILKAHPNVAHLHIGCDEVELGKGASALVMQSKKLSEAQIFLQHVQRVATIVRSHTKMDVTPLIWDDGLRNIHSSDLEDSKLSSLVEIMVWQYTINVQKFVDKAVWSKYAKVFKSVWIATAFKGATGPRQILTEPKLHLKNHLRWLNVIAANSHHLKFKGVALTGWQRYDHFATLCELLPVAIPSLAVCLATMVNGGFTKEIHIATSKLLKCDNLIEMTNPKSGLKLEKGITVIDCRFPGYDLYYAIKLMYGYMVSNSALTYGQDGWLSDYQVAHHFSSPSQLRALTRFLTKQSAHLTVMSISLRRYMAVIYSEDTIDEWMEVNVKERVREFSELQEKIQSFQQRRFWPHRPLGVAVADTRERSKFGGSSKHANRNILKTQVGQKIPLNKFATPLQYQQNQYYINPLKLETDHNETEVSFKTSAESKYFFKNDETIPELNFVDGRINQKHLISRKNQKGKGNLNEEEPKVSKVSLLDQNKKSDNIKEDNNMLSIDQSDDNLDQKDPETRESSNMISQISQPTYFKTVKTPKMLDYERNSNNIQAEENDKTRRDKYVKDVKSGERENHDLWQFNSKFQVPFDLRGPQAEKFNHVYNNTYV